MSIVNLKPQQMTQVNWQHVSLVTCYHLLHRRVSAHSKHWSFCWHRWLVESLWSLRRTIGVLSLFFTWFLQDFLVPRVGSEKFSPARTRKWPYKYIQKNREIMLVARLKKHNGITNYPCQSKEQCFKRARLRWWVICQSDTRAIGCQLNHVICWVYRLTVDVWVQK